jgi:hypothetical protein
MSTKSRVAVALGVVGSFGALVVVINFLWAAKIVTSEMAKLMFAALLGLYVGFGFLIAVYLLIRKMD